MAGPRGRALADAVPRAAASTTAAPLPGASLMCGLRERAEAFVQSWPRPLRREFQAARGRSLGGHPASEGAAAPAPFWVTVPTDLAAAYPKEGGRETGAFL